MNEQKLNLITDEIISEDQFLKLFEGNKVSVYTGINLMQRHEFEPAICVCGILEYSISRGQYRIVINDGTYCYFFYENVNNITYKDDHSFKDGSIAVITLKFLS